ncbi:MAG: alpha/beta fold hydrolase [Candidatus Riflebacteria bacterium]|nr:alpha/beta fold hydrolase [Candidatus Riflebacteria bacterium]
MERRIIEIGGTSIPALIYYPCEPYHQNECGNNFPNCSKIRRLVVVFHGLGGSKEIQKKELEFLANAGFTAVAIDAPHHGERRSSFLDEIDLEKNPECRHQLFIRLVSQASEEIPHLITYFRNEGFDRIAVAGISLGAYTAFGSVLYQPYPDALIPLLGSPDWGISNSPHKHLDRFSRIPIMAVVAGKDTVVLPGPCRGLFSAMFENGMFDLNQVKLLEYPYSEHFMRGEDWDDAWRQIIAFLKQFLV